MNMNQKAPVLGMWAIIVPVMMGLSGLSLAPAMAQKSNAGPSFSCSGVGPDSVESLICADAALANQDRVMATAFSRARASVHASEGHGALLASQRAFLRQRAACAQLRTQKGFCVEMATKERIETLYEWTRLEMDPSRAANRPTKTGTTQGARPPVGPSFNCAQASGVVERAICADRGLSIHDREVAGLYRRLLNAYDRRSSLAPMAVNLRTEQRAFITNRNRCSAKPAVIQACLVVAYENRIQRLSEQLEEVAP
jgi:uncharacterized protein